MKIIIGVDAAMKKITAILLCIILCSIPAVAAGSASDEVKSVPAIVNGFEKIIGNAAVLFGRLTDRFTNEDEIEKAEGLKPSWVAAPSDFCIDNPMSTMSTQCWKMTEIILESTVSYENPFTDTDVDLVLTGNGRQYTIPGFWDGDNVWKVRFVCPSEGIWYYKTVCTDNGNTGLDGITGKVTCESYTGDKAVYQHGFVTTAKAEKYFTYDDGTPFLYLGDTHWSLGDETPDMVRIIADKRTQQGFTVWQSEPIGSSFDFTDGITQADMDGLHDYDEKFSTIAASGLVHANAEFFFPYSMGVLIDKNGGYSDKETSPGFFEISDSVKAYLERISRYWVARYGAFPVMWTLGQEVDNDFYTTSESHPEWSYTNNPYRYVAGYISKYDCYDHPLTAHQENVGETAALGREGKYRDCDPSAFRDVKAHNWYAVQWSPSKTKRSDFSVEKEYWFNSQGKPAINYEGSYCWLWTKNFGSRMQGWCAYLNGMYGYGWGGHDTWSYTNIFNENEDSSDGVDTITSEEKIKATWQDSLEYDSSYQCGYMLDFLSRIAWQNLIPRFGNRAYFAPAGKVYHCMASNEDNSEGVIYFYSFTDESIAQKVNTKSYGGVLTGTIGNLIPGEEYRYVWYNPVTGEYSEEGTFTASCLGTYYIGERQMNGEPVDCDMVFHFYR